MPSPRRNDPCPCGSGRKFKLCCLPQPRLASGITPKDRSEALLALIRYSRRDEFASAVAEATCQWAAQDDGDVNAALQSIVEFQTSADAFCEWLSFDLRLDDGRTLSDWFMDSHGRTVSPRASDHIRLMRQTHLRPFEVRDVTVGAGLTLRDLWTKEEYFVTERKGSTQIVKWDILAARVNTLADGSREIEGARTWTPRSNQKSSRRQTTWSRLKTSRSWPSGRRRKTASGWTWRFRHSTAALHGRRPETHASAPACARS